MDLSGLFKVTGHFGEKAVLGNTDIDGKAKLREDLIPDLFGSVQGGSVK